MNSRQRSASRGPRAEGDSRADILEAARDLFAARGFRATTTRQVAERAGVDVALIHHFFGTKAALFAAAIDLPRIASQIEARIASPGRDPAEALARLYLERLFITERRTLSAMLRTAVGSGDEVPELRMLLQQTIVGVASNALGGKDAALRAELVAAQMIGLLLLRHIVGVEPIASIPTEDLVQRLIPLLRALIATDEERPCER
jgi:AcrR family transcriptional regulator